MSEPAPSKDRLKLARKLAALYSAAVALQSAVEEVSGTQPTVKMTLEGGGFSVSAGSVKFGAKLGGL